MLAIHLHTLIVIIDFNIIRFDFVCAQTVYKRRSSPTMRHVPSLVVALLLCTLLAVPAFADGPIMGKGAQSGVAAKALPNKKAPKPVGPVNMSTGTVFPKGKLATSLKYIYFDKNDLYDGGTTKGGTYNGKYDRWQHTLKMGIRYGLFDDFDIRAMIPFHFKGVKRRARTGTPNETTRTDYNEGLGDIVLMGRYGLLTQRKGDPFSLSVGAGLKLPTGNSDLQNEPPFNAKCDYMGPGFQLGTGSWDPKFEVGATYMFGQSRLDAHCMLTLPTEGDHEMRKGDNFKYNVGYGYALNRLIDLEMELNGVIADKNRAGGAVVDNTGGHTLYLTPGVHFKIRKGLNVGLATPIVIYRDLNADPDTNKYSIGEDMRVVFKIGASF
jgi:hypothetical protein